MRTYQLAPEASPARLRAGRPSRRQVIETGPAGRTVFCLVSDDTAADVVEALTRVYAAGREDADQERAVWWNSPIGRLVQDVVRRPDAEQALQFVIAAPAGDQ